MNATDAPIPVPEWLRKHPQTKGLSQLRRLIVAAYVEAADEHGIAAIGLEQLVARVKRWKPDSVAFARQSLVRSGILGREQPTPGHCQRYRVQILAPIPMPVSPAHARDAHATRRQI